MGETVRIRRNQRVIHPSGAGRKPIMGCSDEEAVRKAIESDRQSVHAAKGVPSPQFYEHKIEKLHFFNIAKIVACIYILHYLNKI